MIFELDDKAVADDTVLVFGIGYPGSNSNRVYSYAGMKVAGRWYFTGTGRTPQDAGWGAVQRWLASDGRRVIWVKVATRMEPLWEDVPEEAGLARHRNDRRTDSWYSDPHGVSPEEPAGDREHPVHAHLWKCGCLINDGGAHRVGCPDHPEGVRGDRLS